MWTPNVAASLLQSSREFSGRAAGCRVLRRGHGDDVGRLEPARLQKLTYRPGKPCPGSFARACTVEHAGTIAKTVCDGGRGRAIFHGFDHACHRVRQVDGRGRPAMLVAYDPQRLGAGREQPKHRAYEVFASTRIHPRGAQDGVGQTGFVADLRDGSLAGQLRCAVDIARPGGVGFDPRPRAAAFEHVVGGEVNQARSACRSFLRQHPGCLAIHGKGCLGILLRRVNGGVRRARHDPPWPYLLHARADACGVLQVELRPPRRNHLHLRGNRSEPLRYSRTYLS